MLCRSVTADENQGFHAVIYLFIYFINVIYEYICAWSPKNDLFWKVIFSSLLNYVVPFQVYWFNVNVKRYKTGIKV